MVITQPQSADTLTLFPMDELLESRLVPVETNLEGYPLFTRQRGSEEKVLEIRQVVRTVDGRSIRKIWKAAASADNTLPGPFDEDVFIGIMALVRRRGGMPEDGRIRFSIYELTAAMGKGKKGGWTRKVRESLDRIASTTYFTENCFYVLETESLESYRFPLWTIHFSRASSKDGRSAEHHTLKFDDVIVRSYNAGYLKLLDTDLYFRLSRQRSPLAKALYRLVDQRRGEARSWSIDVVLLRDLLAMKKSYKAASKIWEVLTTAVRALKREKFLESAVLDGNIVRFKIHSEFARDWIPESEPAQKPAPPSLRQQAIAALIAKKVHAPRARKLVDEHGPEKALHVLEVLASTGALKEKANPGGYVARVVEKGDAEELAETAAMVRSQASPREPESGRLGAPEGRPANDLWVPDMPDEGPGLGPDENPREASGGDSTVPREDPETVGPASDLWDRVLTDVAEGIDETSLRVWFDGVKPLSLRAGVLVIGCPNDFAKEYIETRFQKHLVAALATLGPDLGHGGVTLQLAVVPGLFFDR